MSFQSAVGGGNLIEILYIEVELLNETMRA